MGQTLIWNFLLISQGAAKWNEDKGNAIQVFGWWFERGERVRVKDLNNILCVPMLVRVESTVILGWSILAMSDCDSLIPH